MADSKDIPDLEPVLEEQDTVEMADAGVDHLFSEGIPVMTAKLAAAECFLKLLTSDLKYQDFIREVLLNIIKVVKCEAGSILEIDHKNKNIFFRCAVGNTSDRIVRFVIPMGKGIVGYVAESRIPLVVSNIGENAHHLKAITDAVGFETRNLIALPVIIRGKVYGVIELINRVGESNFTETDIETLTSLCELVARAIEIRLMIAYGAKDTGASGKGEAA